MVESSSADFDVDILDNALEDPCIDLSFPLPSDKETYVELDGNEKLARNFKVLDNLFSFFSREKVSFNQIYSRNEYYISVNKYTPTFNKKMADYMADRLERSDEKLNELVYKLVEQELGLNLIKASEFPERFEAVKKFVVEYYKRENQKNMPTFKSHNFIRVCYITVIKALRQMFPHGIWCSREDFDRLMKKYLENPMSIIYVPNHQSHIDYIIIHIMSIRFSLSIPAVIAGENLNVAIFGKFLKDLGAIFIKRSFNNELYTERNLENLIEFVLLNKIHLEVFIEGTRSRDGKLLLPKFGILKTLTNIYSKQIKEKSKTFDFLFQPMTIAYERIYETDGYLNELTGKDKKQESFFRILGNGVKNLTEGSKKYDYDQVYEKALKNEGIYDNSNVKLSGKMFVKLGESFTMSDFASDRGNLLDPDMSIIKSTGTVFNLKKLGFKILHEVNRSRYIPEVGVVGHAIQIHYSLMSKQSFHVKEIIPFFRLFVKTFKEEEEHNNFHINSKTMQRLERLSDQDIVLLTKKLIPQFFRLINVNQLSDIITIDNSIELLYYKNLSIHLIIHRSLVCFLLSHWKNNETRTFRNVHSLFYIFTGFLKNEFLFDYNYNERNGLSNILACLERKGKIKAVNGSYRILDSEYLSAFEVVVRPFVESYLLCIDSTFMTIDSFYKNALSSNLIAEELLVNDDEIGRDHPTTKTLLKHIQKFSTKSSHVESTNKQYLLSCLFYLNHLGLIKILKNRKKTKAFVVIVSPKDLRFVLLFMRALFEDNQAFLTDTAVQYMTDIIDKDTDRDMALMAKL